MAITTKFDTAKLIKMVGQDWSLASAMLIGLVGSLVLIWQRIDVYLNPSLPQGDEYVFLHSFELFLSDGWYASVVAGSSILFNLAAWGVYQIIPDKLLSLRLVSVSSLLLMVLIWWFYAAFWMKIAKTLLWPLLVFLLTMGLLRNHFFSAVSDPLFSVFISLSFIFLMIALGAERRYTVYYALSGLFMGCALSVRELFLLYVPGFFLIAIGSIWIYRIQHPWTGFGVMTLTFMLVVGCIHAPSLVENRNISYLSKQPTDGPNWQQRNYLYKLYPENGYPSWEAVRAYLGQHGDEALPRSNEEAIAKDLKVTLKSFVDNLHYSIKPFLRHTGLFIIIFIGYPAVLFYRRKKLPDWYAYAAIFLLAYLFFLSILILPNIQFRWYIPFPFLVTVCAAKILMISPQHERLPFAVFSVNLALIGFANIFKFQVW